jgi:GTPase SAR1 family protein
MNFDDRIAKKYRRSIENALQTIFDKGNAFHREMIENIIESEMLVYVQPVSKIKASGVTGLNNWFATSLKIQSERLNLREAFGEVFITIAEETIDTGGQRGCE